jgi:hypothetical protein
MENEKFKAYRVNLVIGYFESYLSYRSLYQTMLKDFGEFFQMECALEEDHLMLSEKPPSLPLVVDIIHFRSTLDTNIERKAFQNLLDNVLAYGEILPNDFFWQPQKALKDFPWPE